MAALSLLLFAACLSDYRSARIPNGLIIMIFMAGCGIRLRDMGGWGLKEYLAGCLPVLLLFYPLFKIGTVGAGDVKILSVTAGFLSGKAILGFLFYSMLIAAIFSVIKMIKERNGKERFLYLCSYLASVAAAGKWKLYLQNEMEQKNAGIRLSGPVLLSVLLHWGGAY